MVVALPSLYLVSGSTPVITTLLHTLQRFFFDTALTQVFFAIVLGAFGMAQAQQAFPDLAKGGAATQRVFKVIKRQPRIDGRDEGERLHAVKGEVQLRDVTFAYPQRREVTVFKVCQQSHMHAPRWSTNTVDVNLVPITGV